MLTKTLTLTDAQIKTLPTTPVEILAAPGADKVNIIHLAYCTLHMVNAYTNCDAGSTAFLVNDADGDFDSVVMSADPNLFGVAGDYFWVAPPAVFPPTPSTVPTWDASFSTWKNKPTCIAAANAALGNFTGGDAANTLKIIVWYDVVAANI